MKPEGTSSEVTSYAASVRAALSDLPSSDLADLLEDLEDHLAEVAAEGGGSLQLRLGTAAAYAAELRQAAGLPVRHADRRPRAREAIDRCLSWLSQRRGVAATVDFLPELRPAWWVARAWLPLLALDLIFGTGPSFPFPTLLGLGQPVGLLLTLAAVAVSVRAGQRGRRADSPRRDRLALVGNSVLALAAVVALFGLQSRNSAPVYAEGGYVAVDGGTRELTHADGSPITNIYPYSADGRPLTTVLLYDQDGRAIDNLSVYTRDGREIERLSLPGSIPAPSNSYPRAQRYRGVDEWGDSQLEATPGPMFSTVSPSAPGPTPGSSAPSTGPTPTTSTPTTSTPTTSAPTPPARPEPTPVPSRTTGPPTG